MKFIGGVKVSNSIIVNAKTREKRYAVIQHEKVSKIIIQQPQDITKVGNVYIGKVMSIKPGINAAFIDIGEGRHGYLHRDQLPSFLHQDDDRKHSYPISKYVTLGQKIIVQVKKDETSFKGPLLTAIIEIQGDRLIYLPEGKYIAVSKKSDETTRKEWRKRANQFIKDPEGLIIRTAAFQSSQSEWEQELEKLRNTYSNLLKQAATKKVPSLLFENNNLETAVFQEMVRLKSGEIIGDDTGFIQRLETRIQTHPHLSWSFQYYNERQNIFSSYHIDGEIQHALKRIVWLENGAYLVIDETEALISIDVNTGKFTGKQNQKETVLKTNILAAKAIGTQLKLRDYGGMILIDFIDMQVDSYREEVRRVLQEELKKDPRQTKIIGFTPLGILEMTRKKTRKSLAETLLMPCPVCKGSGKIESPETLAFRLERELWEMLSSEYDAVLIECTEDVKDCFCGDNQIHLQRLETFLHMKLLFHVKQDAHPFYSIRQFGRYEDLRGKLKLSHAD